MNQLSYIDDISEKEYKYLKRKSHLKFCWSSQIIFLNYNKCLENNWIKYYYDLYCKKFEKDNKIDVSFEDFSKYLDRTISLCCKLLSSLEIKQRWADMLERIDFVYWDLINDAEKIWSNIIVNK